MKTYRSALQPSGDIDPAVVPAATHRGRIVVGTDGSPDAIRATRWAASLARSTGSSMCLVHVVEMATFIAGRAPRSAGFDYASTLASASGPVGAIAADAVDTVVVSGRPAMVIADVALHQRADLIVVGQRGAHQAHGSTGSTARELIEHATVPVVVVPCSSPEVSTGFERHCPSSG